MRALKSGVDDNRQKINELIEQNKQLSDKIDTMENAGDKMKAHMLRNNLIFHGIPQSGLETWEQMEELLCGFITDKLDIDGSQIEFQIVHRLTYARSRPQPIIGKFLRYKQRDEVLRAAVKLKGTEFRIREDFTPKIRDLRRKLGKFVVDARAE
ncbi:uncharacterized protein LOC102801500, partial [Saccoglossus kowalevskii]|uniref:Uncharacterized protein LOC102801500 n=1 Tax=Saccoglossus kowalevskii TaxID=10224 RepID=A0ABM0LV58_SACKO